MGRVSPPDKKLSTVRPTASDHVLRQAFRFSSCFAADLHIADEIVGWCRRGVSPFCVFLLLISCCQLGLAKAYSSSGTLKLTANEKGCGCRRWTKRDWFIMCKEQNRKGAMKQTKLQKKKKRKENLTCCMFDLRQGLSASGMWHKTEGGFYIILFYASSWNASKGGRRRFHCGKIWMSF